MDKAKSPKLHRLSLFTSFQICRPKKASSMIKPPYMLSPLNYKTLDISFPAPPPSTPSKIVPLLDCRLPSSFACSHSKTIRSTDSDDGWRQVPSSRNHKKTHKNYPKPTSKSCITSNETESLMLSSPPLKTVYEEKQLKPRRFRRYCEEKKAPSPSPCMSESFVVVKKSVDPYEDFKRSMSEMIVEKQIFEPKELEQLLMSFLSLNSRLHHKVIIEAFTQILKEVFCG